MKDAWYSVFISFLWGTSFLRTECIHGIHSVDEYILEDAHISKFLFIGAYKCIKHE